jgi:hypothetical protein
MGAGEAPLMKVAMEEAFTVCVAVATVVPSMVMDHGIETA